MAKSRPTRRQPQAESKKALVIFLVFFILTTIGAGFFGYQGYMEDAGKQNTINSQKDKITQLGMEKEFLEYQAMLYRRYMGQENKADKGKLDDEKRKFMEHSDRWTNAGDYNDVAAVMNNVEKRLKTVAQEKHGAAVKDIPSFEQALEIEAEQVLLARKALPPLTQNQADYEKAAKDEKQLRLDEKKAYDTKLEELNTRLTSQAKDQALKIKDLQTEVDVARAQLLKKDQELAAVRQTSVNDLVLKNKQIKTLTGDLAKANEAARAKGTGTDSEGAELQVRGVGHILDRRGESVYIDLGLNQKMTPQMTFSIHAAGPEGLPLAASKGTIEVVNVFEAGSQARIQLERSQNNAIGKGDVLVNPNWNPNRKKHVAIVGVVDLTGEGRNQMREFRQLLEQQNVVVDAFVEPLDNQWVLRGTGMTRETNYLILGDGLADKKDETPASKNLEAQITTLKKQAINNGVQILSLRNYLDMIGYQPPRGAGAASAAK